MTILAAAERYRIIAITWLGLPQSGGGTLPAGCGADLPRHELQYGLRKRIPHRRQKIQECHHRFDVFVAHLPESLVGHHKE